MAVKRPAPGMSVLQLLSSPRPPQVEEAQRPAAKPATGGLSVLEMLSSPPAKVQSQEASQDGQPTPAKVNGDSNKKARLFEAPDKVLNRPESVLKALGKAAERAPAAEERAPGKRAKTPPGRPAAEEALAQKAAAEGAGSKSAESAPGKAVVEASGKKLQKRVNEKKNKEEERLRAAELLQANAGKFAATLEDHEEPSDAVEEVEDETWDYARRLQLAETAWIVPCDGSAQEDQGPPHALSSPAFDPAAVPAPLQGGQILFSALASFLETATRGPAPTICAVANLVRQVVHHSSDREADLNAILTVLLASKGSVGHRHLADAVTLAFSLRQGAARTMTADELAESALAERLKQRALFQRKRVTIGEVAAVLEEYAALNLEAASGSGNWLRVFAHHRPDNMVKLLGSSVAEGRETWHLVRVLQGHMGFSWDLVVRGLAHAVTLAPFAAGPTDASASPTKPPQWADARARAEAMLAMEDAVLRAYSQDGGRTGRLVKALVAGKTAEELVAACSPVCGVPILPMRAEAAKEVAQALEKVGPGPLLAEWLLSGERAQVHVKEGGKVVTVFTTKMGPRPERTEDAAAILAGHLPSVDNCVLDVIFGRAVRRAAKPAGEAEGREQSEAVPERDREGGEREKEHERSTSILGSTMMAFDLLMLNGEPMTQRPLRERRAELQRVVEQHARLKLAKGAEIPPEEVSEKTVLAKLDEALSASYLTSGEEKLCSRAMGIVLKRLDGPGATYLAGRPSVAWQALEKPPVTGPEADRLIFEALTPEEQKLVPAVEEFHFCVVSGFRTRTVEGITDILRIQKFYNDAGVVPTWYVDNECPEEYRKLGLKVVKAGKLIPARNLALEDAVKDGKICVQTSDDIGCWQFFNDQARYPSDEEANAAWKRCEKLNVSPVAAARFLAAKMRARGEGKCRLGGVYPLSNGGRAMRARPFSYSNFILGDFFVAEVSECRFDERLSLKEDYDFTASHLERYGEALRCNRLVVYAKHETNAGGACDVRDAEGKRERYNIGVLKEKWPGAIGDHPTRANQIVLRWKSLKKPKLAGQGAKDEAAAMEP